MPPSAFDSGRAQRAATRRAALLAAATAPEANSAHIPADVLEAVWQVTASAWAFSGRGLVQVPRAERAGAIVRGAGSAR